MTMKAPKVDGVVFNRIHAEWGSGFANRKS
jgi:hypothetical protein